MRLTAEIIQNGLSYINPLGERELDLRGHQFTHIENMGAASSDIECIDFTDNHIQVLGNFPSRPRVTTLLLARNRLVQIQPAVARSMPALASLSLAENNIKELADLDPLGGFAHLINLNLVGNPVTKKEHYRYYLVFRIPSLRFFDHQRVRDAERTKAKELFGTRDEPSELAQKIMSKHGAAADADGAGTGYDGSGGAASANDVAVGVARVQLTDDERVNVRSLIRQAVTLDEIARLETMLNEGKIPGQ